ncbi:MAG: Mut7-C RNAse domain-containing protein [Planctomycetota bacterium]
MEDKEPQPVFICDAMLGGLARWLRAAGYEAEFDVHIDDGELVRKAYKEEKTLLTSDGGILDRYALREGLVDYVFVPRGLDVVEQLAHVLGEMELAIKDSRCMDCGGKLEGADLDQVRESVPQKVRRCCSEYWRCAGCGKVYWRGTHWQSIARRLEHAKQLARGE